MIHIVTIGSEALLQQGMREVVMIPFSFSYLHKQHTRYSTKQVRSVKGKHSVTIAYGKIKIYNYNNEIIKLWKTIILGIGIGIGIRCEHQAV